MPKMSRCNWRRYIVASTAHQEPRMPRNGWICKSSMKWLPRLTGEPGRWEWLNLYGIVRKWLLGLTGDHDHSEITRSNCGSYSGPYGSLRMQNMTKMSDYTLHQYTLSHRVHWGPLAPLRLGWGLGLTINLTYDPSRPLWLNSQVSHNSSLLAPDHCLHWSHDSMRLPPFPCILCRADQCKLSALGPLHILHSPCSCLIPLPPFT